MKIGEVRRFIGRPGVVVIQQLRGLVRWRWAGLKTRRPFVARNVFRALMDAAHSCRLSGMRAEFRQIRTRGSNLETAK